MRLLVIALFTLALNSCGPLEREQVKPVAEVQTLADVLGTGNSPTIDLVFKFEDIDVAPPVRRIPIPLIGTVVSEIGNTLAEVFIAINRDWSVKQEPLILDLPALDPETLKGLEVTKLDLKIVPGSVTDSRNPLVNFWNTITFKRAHLKFLNRMTIFVASEEMYERGEWARIARYKKGEQEIACEGKCLSFNTRLVDNKSVDLAQMLQEGGRIYVRPDVEVKATPKRSFNLAGEIRLKVTLHPLF